MGFMRGVPFFWSLKLFHILIFNMIILLMLFYFLDRRAYRKDIAEGRKPDIREPGTHVRIVGLHNLIYVAMIVGAVILSGMLPGMSAFQNADGTPRMNPIRSGGSPIGVRHPPILEIRKIKKIIM